LCLQSCRYTFASYCRAYRLTGLPKTAPL